MAWSNERLQELTASFVPCADEVWRLQNGRDAEARLFQRFCDEGHYDEPGRTRQGIYAVTPSGRLLGSLNHRRPEHIEAVLRDALAAWKQLPAEQRALSAEDRAELESVHRFEDWWPDDGLVLEVTSRDLPREEQERPDRRDRRRRWTDVAWNRDYAWFLASEAERFVPEPPEPGAVREVPRELIQRIVRLNLLDNVRGQTPAYDEDDVRRAELTATVESVEDGVVSLRLSGASFAEVTEGEYPRSFRASLHGHARWSAESRRFEAFELVAVGERTGATRFNNRQRDPGPAPIGVVLRLAPPDAPRVAPAYFWHYGWRRGAR